jgi:hypothetical protein
MCKYTETVINNSKVQILSERGRANPKLWLSVGISGGELEGQL